MASKRRSALWSANQNPVVGDAVGRCAIGGHLRGNLDHRVNGLVLGPEQANGIAIDTLSRPVLKRPLDNFGAVDYANSTKLACARIAAVGLVVGLFRRVQISLNVLGPEGAWNDGREKAPAALCRKVAEASGAGEVQIWGDAEQTRSFLYIDECLEGSLRLMRSECGDVLNVGSDEMVSINALVAMIAGVANKAVRLKHIPGPLGVRGRNSDNRLIAEKLGWRPREPLIRGIRRPIPGLPRKSRRQGSAAACQPRARGRRAPSACVRRGCARRCHAQAVATSVSKSES